MIKWLSSRLMTCFVGSRNTKGLKISYQNSIYRRLKDEQWKTEEYNVNLQKEKLYEIVKFTLQEVPYYKEMNIDVNDFSVNGIYDDIKKLPILTKDIMRKQKEHLYPERDVTNWVYENISGGTTGEPVRFKQCDQFFDYDQAGKRIFDEWAGRKLGGRQVRLWGSARDIVSGKKDWMNKIYRWCRNEMFLNSFKMSDDIMEEYIKAINKKKPKMILAYVQSIRELAEYIERNDRKVWSPDGIMTSAGTLDEETYELLVRVFKCPILNRYGSREVGDMACSCMQNEGLHINMPVVYLEVLDDEGNTCPDGVVGNIVVTSLVNHAMPIIRYKIGDVGALTSHKCSCGRGWSMLKSVNGRTVDVFKAPNGTKIDGGFFTHLCRSERNIKQYQVIQDKIDHLLVKLVFYDADIVTSKFYEDFEKEICNVMGNNITFDYEIVDYIPATNSGKRAYTISLI